MTNKIDTILKAIIDRIAGTLPSDMVKNLKLGATLVLSARSYPTIDPQCSSHPSNSINAIKAHFKEATISQTSLQQSEIETIPPPPEELEPTLEDEFQDLHLNLPVLEVLAHALIYNAILDKYVESLELGKNISTFFQVEIPTEMKDPGLFTLPCRLGGSKPFYTLADLGSYVNIIPLYLFKKLNMGLLKETDHIFGLADGTKSYLVGIVKDVEVQIGKLKLLNDFYQEASPAIVEPLRIELSFLEDKFQEDPPKDPPEVSMADDRTMAELFRAPTEGYEDEIVIPEIAANNFELKHDSLNSAAGGNFLDKMPRECLKIIESKSKVRQSRAKAVIAKVSTSSSTLPISSDVAKLKDMVRALLLDKKNQSSAPAPASSSTPAPVKAVEPNCFTCGGSGTLPSNTVTNPKEDLKGIITRSGVAYQGPTIPTPSKVAKQRTEVTKDQVQTPSSQSTAPVQPPVIQFETQTLTSEPVVAPVDRSVSKPVGIAKDVSVKVGVFHFPADFVVVDFKPDPRTDRSLIDVHKGELTLCIGNEAITYNLDQTSRYSANYSQMTVNKIDVIDLACEEYSQEVLGFFDVTTSGNPAPHDDPIVSTTSPTLTPFGDEGDILLLEAILNSEPLTPLLNQDQYLPSFKKELKVCEAKTVKSFVDEPLEVELKDLPPHIKYAFLEGDNKLPIYDVIKKEVEKLLDAGLIYPISDSPWVSPVHCVPKKGGFAVVENEENKLILTRLVTGWRGMNTIVSSMVSLDFFKFTSTLVIRRKQRSPVPMVRLPIDACLSEVFMDDFSVFGNSFENYLSRLEKMLQRCEDTSLSLNWEKNHFMVKKGIVLGHKISKNGIEVDKAKVDVISKLPHPTTVKGVWSFLGHAGFYRRFIQDFSKISRPMTHLLEKNTLFIFSEDCIKAFQTLKKKLTEAPILISPNWDLPFELMCDASVLAKGAVLGQRHEKHFRPIHYASKTMTDAESNYTTIEIEMLAVVYAFEKFRSYLIMNK
nr:reverse transcriptase domain-containing protein [Tanacetum cinerariifolium]